MAPAFLAFVDKLAINFAPIAKSSRSARTFLFQITADGHKDLNPKLALAVNQNDSIRKPSIEVTYRDKKHLIIESGSLKVADIMRDIQKHAKKLQLEEDTKNSS
ncbi:hypothetical protein HDU79_004712 [Rhizoclosmatium sp. JEL0117]|nr:hypothetical protein HDU79_004712 [Rhizoclosmatium sp. JEL0117]